MKKIILTFLLFSLIITFVFAGIEPQKDWRYRDIQIYSYPADQKLTDSKKGEDIHWTTGTTESWLAIRFPSTKIPIPLMLTYGGIPSKSSTEVCLEMSLNSKDGNDGDWKEMEKQIPKWRLEKFTFSTSTIPIWYRIRIDSSTTIHVTDIGLYRLDGEKRKDYWLIIGASIQAQSIRNSVFKNMVKEKYPDYDPVIFNLAVSGWRSDHLLKALPEFLKSHPYASYVGIHIGGNNVTPNRPYPGGADKLKEELIAILEMIQKDGKTPILSRLSYRAYKGDKPVPPEENGSGPYVTQIYDPLIKQYCPLFFDIKNGKGKVNAYDWFKEHQDELSADGIHVKSTGEESWNRLWVEGAGPIIYSPDSNQEK